MLLKACVKRVKQRAKDILLNNKGRVGMDEILGVAIVLIIAAFIVFPQFRTFATTVMTALGDWWDDTISGEIFETSSLTIYLG